MNKLYKALKVLKGVFYRGKIVYIVDGAQWSIYWDGKNIVKQLNRSSLIKGFFKAKVDDSYYGYKYKIVHLGSFHLFFQCVDDVDLAGLSLTNKIVLTIFHVNPASQNEIKKLLKNLEKIAFIHTSCQLTKKQLINFGIPEEKIVVIPLGVDLSFFKPINCEARKKLRTKLGLPQEKIIIGSFQKDGNGWGQGTKPKLIKGPDVFCDVLEKLAGAFPVHVMLTGPARGYVKNRLEKLKIPYTYKYLPNYLDIIRYYQILDMYVVTSKIEGGPKAILESMACGIPFVSTKVGMVPDIVSHGKNGCIANGYSASDVVEKVYSLLNNEEYKLKLIEQALRDVKKYDWELIAKKYYEKIYSKLI